MKKILLLMVALLTLGGVNAVKAERATKTPLLLLRNGVINTNDFDIAPFAPSTLTADNLYAATFTSKGGYCNTFKYENLDVSGYDKAVVKYTIEEGNGDWEINLPNGQFTALPIGTDQEYEISLKDVDSYGDFTVFSWNHSGKSITISEVYLFKEGTTKILDVDLSKLPAKSENTAWAWNAETSTGTFSWSNNSWNSTELFGAGNYSAYTTLNLETQAGTDNFRIIFKFTNGAGQVTIDPVATGTQSIKLADYVSLTDLANVSTIRLSGNGSNGPTTGDITVSKVYLEGPNVIYIEATTTYEAPIGTTDVNGMTGAGDIKWNIAYPQSVKNETLWGGDIDSDNQSVSISDYDYLHFVVTNTSADAHTGLRVFVWDGSARQCLYPHPIKECAGVTDWKATTWITEPGVYVVKISDYPLLRGFKALQGWAGNAGSIDISMAYVSKGDAPAPYLPSGKYTLIGEATGSVTLTAALADPNASQYEDEYGLTVLLDTAASEGFKDEYCCGAFVTEDLAVNHPEVAAAFTRAVLKAAVWVNEHPEEAAQIQIDKDYVAGDAEFNAKVLRSYNYIPSVQGGYDAIQLSVAQLTDIGILKEGTVAKDFADGAYIFFDDEDFYSSRFIGCSVRAVLK